MGEYKGLTPSRIKANKKYLEKQDSFSLRCSREQGQVIRDAAARAGKSVNQFIFDCVKKQLESDSKVHD